MSWHSSYFASWELQRSVVRPRRRIGLRGFVGIAVALVVALKLVVAPWIVDRLGCSLLEHSRRFVKEYAEAIPRWQEAHPGRSCPGGVRELTEYTRLHDVRDGYGEELQLLCTAKGIVVYSLGEDGKLGTADDLWGSY
jgi:hypothetical protein